jgi:hypothetical protein
MILENYESVAERIEKFWNHYLGIGRIDTELVYQDGTRYIIKAYGYRETTDLVPFATGYAEEIRSNANRHPIENAETSAIGRMLHAAGISKFSDGIERSSLEEMRSYQNKLSVVPSIAEAELIVKESSDPWALVNSIEATESAVIGSLLNAGATNLQCKHGFMNHKSGVGKTGKPYDGYVCPETDRNQQCKPVWL